MPISFLAFYAMTNEADRAFEENYTAKTKGDFRPRVPTLSGHF